MYTYMIERPFWISRIEKAWEEASIVWLASVKRATPTGGCDMCKDLPNN